MCLHADVVHAAAETYIGLVEVGVGLIPGGGGTKAPGGGATTPAIAECGMRNSD